MTDYNSHRIRHRAHVQLRLRDMLAVLITIFLILVIFNGFLKGINLRNILTSSVWDGSSTMAIAVDSEPASIFIIQKEPKRLLVLTIPNDVNYATGDATKPVGNVVNQLKMGGDNARNFLTRYFGVNVAAYANLNGVKKMDKNKAREFFKNFAFLAKPISIIFNGLNNEISSTNLSKLDLLKLWWLVKGINENGLAFIDLDKYSIEIIGVGDNKFKGLDRDLVRKDFSEYFENSKLVGKNIEVEINNASGVNGFGTLASEIAEIGGFDIVSVKSADVVLEKTRVDVLGEINEAVYLAKMFNCDIFRLQNDVDKPMITLVIGRDFAKRFQ